MHGVIGEIKRMAFELKGYCATLERRRGYADEETTAFARPAQMKRVVVLFPGVLKEEKAARMGLDIAGTGRAGRRS